MKCRIGMLLFLLILLMAGCAREETNANLASATAEETELESERIELYYFSPCESCQEDDAFRAAVEEALSAGGVETRVEYRTVNAFQEAGRARMAERMEELGHEMQLNELPAAVVNDTLYYGGYQEIGEQIAQVLLEGETEEADSVSHMDGNASEVGADLPETGRDEQKAREEWEGLRNTDTVLVLFTTFSCDSCDRAKEYLTSQIGGSSDVASGVEKENASQVRLLEFNILEEDHMELLDAFMAYGEVPSEEQQVPILFYRKGYLSGEKAIQDGLEEAITDEECIGTDWLDEIQQMERDADKANENGTSLFQLFGIGLLNGLNPCAASMLLMVLSILLMKGKGFVSGGLAYMAGKLLAYVGMGMGAFWLLSLAGGGFGRMQEILTWLFALAALALSLFNLRDYWKARKKEYGKVLLQLPKSLRDWNHRMIEKLKNLSSVWMLPALFLLGLVISAGEFFCTGQLYVASIYNLVRENGYVSADVWLQLLVYVVAMCIPQLVLILVIGKTRNLLSASRFALEGMPAVKLIYAAIFFFLFLSLLLL